MQPLRPLAFPPSPSLGPARHLKPADPLPLQVGGQERPAGDGMDISPATTEGQPHREGAMLPTPPASLPLLGAGLLGRGGSAEPPATSPQPQPRSDAEDGEGELRGMEGTRGTTPFFALELAGGEGEDRGLAEREGEEEDEDGGDAMDYDAPAGNHFPLLPSAPNPFSATRPIVRSFRSRYAPSESPAPVDPAAQEEEDVEFGSPPTFLGSPTLFEEPEKEHDDEEERHQHSKRSHSQISPASSLGRTPPSYHDSSLPPASAADPAWRRSFPLPASATAALYDAQRAAPPSPPPVAAPSPFRFGRPPTPPRESATGGLLRRRARSSTAGSGTMLAPVTAAGEGQHQPGLGRERGSSKRRRSGTLSLSHDGGGGGETSSAAHSHAPPSLLRPRSPTARPFLSASTAAASPTSSAFFTAPSAVSPAPSALSLSLSIATAPSAAPPVAAGDFLTHARRSEELQAHGEGLLREAEGVLRRAEESVGRARGLVQEEAERRRVEEVRHRLPSPPSDAHGGRAAGVVVGVRLGEGWDPPPPRLAVVQPQAQQPASPGRRRRSSLLFGSFSPASPPLPATALSHSSPALGSPTSPPSTAAASSSFFPTTASSSSATAGTGRARQFLTQLRARRPRLGSRSGSGASELDSPTSPSSPPSALRLRAYTLPSPPPSLPPTAPALLPSASSAAPPVLAPPRPFTPLSAFDEPAERAVAERLNERVIERRRASQSLWGEPAAGEQEREERLPSLRSMVDRERERQLSLDRGDGPGGGGAGRREMRLPTQAANERWRRGERPTSGWLAAAPAPPLATAARTEEDDQAGPRLRRSFTAAASPSGWATASPPAVPGPAATTPTTASEEADRHWFRTEPSPSPPSSSSSRRRAGVDAARRASTVGPFPSFRLPSLASPSSSSARGPPAPLGDSDADVWETEEHGRRAGRAGGWAPPSSLPPMLPSGSDGHRAGPFPAPSSSSFERPGGGGAGVLFPHLAAARGEEGRRGMGWAGWAEDEERERERGGGWGWEELDRAWENERGRESRSESPYGGWGPTHLIDSARPARLPPFGFEPTRSASSSSSRRRMPWDDPDLVGSALPSSSSGPPTRFNPFGDAVPPSSSSSRLPRSSATAEAASQPPITGRLPPSRPTSDTLTHANPRSSLADALARFDSRPTPSTSTQTASDTLRRRHTASGWGSSSLYTTRASPAAAGAEENPYRIREEGEDPDNTADFLARFPSRRELIQHNGRVERLATLRRERNIMRSLLGAVGSPPRDAPSSPRADRASPEPVSPPGSPGTRRRRSLGLLLRSLSGGGPGAADEEGEGRTRGRRGWGGRGFAIFDEDFGFFGARGGWGGAIGADPRDYLDDSQFDDSYEALLRLSERLGDVKPKGVSSAKLDALRRFKYGEWTVEERDDAGSGSSEGKGKERERPARLAVKGVEKDERCGICLCDYEDDDVVMQLECNHGSHEECLTAWLKDHANCPICRRDHAA
ncbi:hypothetical protein JCM8097_008420 [Rhodosporidiobolus ruineniae]